MTAHGSRRTALCLVLAALALLGWQLWTRHAANAAAIAKTPQAARVGATPAAVAAGGRHDAAWTAGRPPSANGSGGAGDEAACLPARRARLRGVRDALDPSASAHEAFAHALLGEALAWIAPYDEDAERRETVRQEAEWQAARRRWPSDLDIAWQAANKCMAKFGCDEQEALDHLLELDPGNAAAWWLAMNEAWQRHDDAAYDAALAHAAASRAADARRGSVFLALQPLLARAPMQDQCLRADDAAELEKIFGHPPGAADLASVEAWSFEGAGNSIVSYSAFAGCREHDAGRLSPRRRADCIASLAVLAGGDTQIEQGVALPMLIQLTGDSADGLAYRERYRQLLYLFLAAPPNLIAGDPNYVLSFGEVETLRRAAIARHRWPPPADWLPYALRQRMLVTRGQVPVGYE